ncbi:hypothetical protein RJT34_16550 [Clitoria ternatea]|uniref:Gfo/Idh/MocA-like oxidoreductase N-terminal domain-containing protein n=1 Tax=Clitoria ternatea TaxID=43366 RepID=A0AAN9J7M5_CLITE
MVKTLKIQFGIIGCADIACKVSHVINLAPNATFHAVGSHSLNKARAFAVANGFPEGAKVYGLYEAVLDDPDIDAVYMSLPTSLHLRWVSLAARKKKHVLLEKPMVLSASEFKEIIEACESNGLQLMDGNDSGQPIRETALSLPLDPINLLFLLGQRSTNSVDLPCCQSTILLIMYTSSLYDESFLIFIAKLANEELILSSLLEQYILLNRGDFHNWSIDNLIVKRLMMEYSFPPNKADILSHESLFIVGILSLVLHLSTKEALEVTSKAILFNTYIILMVNTIVCGASMKGQFWLTTTREQAQEKL